MKDYSLGKVKVPKGKTLRVPSDAKDKLMVGLEKGMQGYIKKGMKGKHSGYALKQFK